MARRRGNKVASLDRQHFSYWQAWYRSFYSPQLYLDVAKRWRGFGLLYFLTLCALIIIPYSIRVMKAFDEYYTEQVLLPMKKLPKLYIVNGKVTVDLPMPYKILDNKGEVVAIVDTTGKVAHMNNKYPNLSILITENKIYYRPPTPTFFLKEGDSNSASSSSEIKEHVIPPQLNEIFVGEEWLETTQVRWLKYFGLVLIYPTLLASCLGIYLPLVFVFSMLGQVLSSTLFKVKLSFKQSCRLLSVAATPMIGMVTLLLSLGVLFHGLGYLGFAVLTVYYSFALTVIKHNQKKMVLA